MFLKAIIYTSASSTDVLLKTFPRRTVFMKRFKFFLQNTANFWSLHVFTKYENDKIFVDFFTVFYQFPSP